MDDVPTSRLTVTNLAGRADFKFGAAVISPSTRRVRGPLGEVTLEPRVMQVLIVLAEANEGLVTRETLFRRCWGLVAVGDDSLNRTISALRRLAQTLGPGCFSIRTVPGSGYALSKAGSTDSDAACDPHDAELAVKRGFDSWRLNLPAPDWPRIAELRQVVAAMPTNAEAWGVLALLLRIAAEYAEADDCTQAVDDCQLAATRALSLDPSQTNARAALASLAPLFGDWIAARSRLVALHEADPVNVPAAHDLAVLEMATGRPSAAIPIIARLIEADPLGAIFHYKRVYHLWTLGQLGEMDRVADRAMQLWPRHPAIWHCRLWSLAFTGRAPAALAQVEDDANRPPIPSPAVAMLHATMQAASQTLAPDDPALAAVVAQNLGAAARGPAQCVAAIIHLSGLGDLDAAFNIANAYLARRGPLVVPLAHTAADPSVNEQHRRVTQMLFLPVTAPMREDPRFLDLCEAMGLAAYWRETRITPDFLRPPKSVAD